MNIVTHDLLKVFNKLFDSLVGAIRSRTTNHFPAFELCIFRSFFYFKLTASYIIGGLFPVKRDSFPLIYDRVKLILFTQLGLKKTDFK